MNKSNDKTATRVRFGYLIAFILLLISYFICFLTMRKVVSEANWVNHSHQVTNNLGELFSEMKDGESAMRGYFLSKDPLFLDQYHNTSSRIDSLYNNIRVMVSDNPSQQENLLKLKEGLYTKIAFCDKIITLFNANGYEIPDSLKHRRDGKLIMDNVRSAVRTMQQNENDILQRRTKQFDRFSRFILFINVFSLLFASIIIFYSLVLFNKENAEKHKRTEEYQAQMEMRIQELAQLNKELIELKSIEKFALTGRISRTIAHEVRNPLTNINLAIEQLKFKEGNDEDTSMMLEMISRNSTRINDLISDLLNSTRSNLLVFDKRDINEVLDESIELAQDRIDLKGIRVVKKYEPELCIVAVDVQKIKIAFVNIIVNAIEAMEKGNGVLNLQTRKAGDKCQVMISDNGKGMDQEGVDRLFEAYYTTKQKGNGLGLTNTQNIILSHKGSISVESELGKGTAFTITFGLDKT